MKKLLLQNHSFENPIFTEIKDFEKDFGKTMNVEETILLFDLIIKPPLVTLAQVGVVIQKNVDFVIYKKPASISEKVICEYAKKFEFDPKVLIAFFAGEYSPKMKLV